MNQFNRDIEEQEQGKSFGLILVSFLGLVACFSFAAQLIH